MNACDVCECRLTHRKHTMPTAEIYGANLSLKRINERMTEIPMIQWTITTIYHYSISVLVHHFSDDIFIGGLRLLRFNFRMSRNPFIPLKCGSVRMRFSFWKWFEIKCERRATRHNARVFFFLLLVCIDEHRHRHSCIYKQSADKESELCNFHLTNVTSEQLLSFRFECNRHWMRFVAEQIPWLCWGCTL